MLPQGHCLLLHGASTSGQSPRPPETLQSPGGVPSPHEASRGGQRTGKQLGAQSLWEVPSGSSGVL